MCLSNSKPFLKRQVTTYLQSVRQHAGGDQVVAEAGHGD